MFSPLSWTSGLLMFALVLRSRWNEDQKNGRNQQIGFPGGLSRVAPVDKCPTKLDDPYKRSPTFTIIALIN